MPLHIRLPGEDEHLERLRSVDAILSANQDETDETGNGDG